MKRRSGLQVRDRVHAAVELVRVAEAIERDLPHPRHDPHVERDVDGVGDLDADLRERRVRGTHDVGHHVHRPALHRAVVDRAELPVRVLGIHPVVGRTRLRLRRGADEGEVLDPGDVTRARVMVVAARPLLLVERDQHLLRDRLLGEALLLGLAAVAPVDAVRLRELRHLFDPAVEMGVLGGSVVGGHRELSFFDPSGKRQCRRGPMGGGGSQPSARPAAASIPEIAAMERKVGSPKTLHDVRF